MSSILQFEGAERRVVLDERRIVADERREKESRSLNNNNHVVVRTGSTDSVKSQRRIEEHSPHHEKSGHLHSPG